MSTYSGAGAKRLIKIPGARCVHTGMETMYRAINNYIWNDDGGGLVAGRWDSRTVSLRRRQAGLDDHGNPSIFRQRTERSRKRVKLIYHQRVSSAYLETGRAQDSTRKMTAHKHGVPTRRDLRITIRTHVAGVTL